MFLGEDTDGKYWIQLTGQRNSWQNIPESERIMVDCGAVIIFDKDDCLITVYAPGEWAHVIHDSIFEDATGVSDVGDLP